MPTDPAAVQRYLDVDFDRRGMEELVSALADRPADAPFAYVVTPNVDHVIRLHGEGRDERLAEAYAHALARPCDSRILARLAALEGIRLAVAPGSDLTARLLAAVRPGDRIAIIGGDGETAGQVAPLVPGAEIVQHVPPMGLRTNKAALAEAAAFVAAAKARFVFLAVGCPQQEYLALEIARRGDATGLGLCIGASIDFLTGRARRAPRWMQRAGLEWSYRLLSEPRRLWRRYLVEGPRIFRIAWRARRG
ncbi:WecB/TagA/CpsF family glycosyltransferase [Edaphosphingomonas haloaromaticamans]|uniref:UDP-N-acetyl-D-mannosaminuronic acid transferase n=1 Tax=Edaphosphingomonas haloaromaticamans TaxID=653954 RepID=A0A1S1HF79_9SPHN|nr:MULTISPECIES: WecB/TagA/CpsF family glycosyltransferase [Sphingomonas]MDX3883576.1 WecB/TagA/CpsF family glycosyltransferase [Sphingomonas sp.]OHT20864.1 UDP-N-acetyl-D-mannosaminuronic acid transferase [Sphingomonas haloaromaticamans]